MFIAMLMKFNELLVLALIGNLTENTAVSIVSVPAAASGCVPIGIITLRPWSAEPASKSSNPRYFLDFFYRD